MAGPALIADFADRNPDVFFVEIGANDGDQHDHLRALILDRGWRGLMVEPVPYVFERLQRNYSAVEGVTLVNAAVGPADGLLPFYHLVDASADERARLPDWYDGLGSFRREVLLGHAKQIPDIEARLVTTDVETLSFDTLCERHGVDSVNVLVIDAEGYDAEILASIDIARWSPEVLLYEHFHLARPERDRCAKELRDHGYLVVEEGFDTYCLGPRADGPTRLRWQAFKPAVRGVSSEDEK